MLQIRDMWAPIRLSVDGYGFGEELQVEHRAVQDFVQCHSYVVFLDNVQKTC